jgi:hypothetical protein
VSLLLLAAGACFAVIYSLNSVIQTLRRNGKIGYWDVQFAFLATLVSAAAVLLNYWNDAPDTQLDFWALIVGGALIAISLLLTLIEVFRPQRLRGSRGVLGIFGGLLIVISSIGIPFAAAYFALESLPPAPPSVTAVAQAEVTEAPLSRGAEFFYAIRDAIREEINVEDQVITDALEAGTPLRQIVEQYGGDVERVIDRITVAMDDWVREGIAVGEIGQLQGALLLSQLENIVRLAVNTDINRFAERFGRATPAPGMTQESVFSLVSPPPGTAAPATDAPTVTPTRTASPPTATPRSPSRTPSPTRTRYQFSTRTLASTLTPTEVVICQATVANNLRLRAAPSQDAETLLTIPADTVIFLSGRSGDNQWWQTRYDDQAGWVSGEFLLLAAACQTLPISGD